jgi:hypothetical protein
MEPQTLTDEEVKALLQRPHNLFIVDRILAMNVGPFLSSVTLGNPAPGGQIVPIATLNMTTDSLLCAAESIVAAIKAQAPRIKEEQSRFQKRLK